MPSESSQLIEQWLVEPDRVCPVLAAPAIIRGRELRMRVGGQEHSIKAPRRFLERLFTWCSGETTRSEIERLAIADQLGPKFGSFVDALMAAGILVDAARQIERSMEAAQYPSWLGQAAPAPVWEHVHSQLADQLPTDAPTLPDPVTPTLSRLLGARQSASRFAKEAVLPAQLSSLLAAMYGSSGGGAGGRVARAVASAGSFYRLRVTLALMKPVGEWAAGMYKVHYALYGAVGLERIADLPATLIRAFVQPHRLIEATGVVMLSSDLRLGSLKYRNRIYPYALLEAGAALQNAALACAEMDIGWRTLGGFDDGLVARMCAIEHATALVTGVFGSKSAAPEPDPPPLAFDFAWSNAVPPFPFCLASAKLAGVDDDAGKPCWGRDRDPVRAFDKALAEATERAAYRLPRNTVWACASELAEDWLDPDKLVRYEPAQYRRGGFPLVRFVEHERRQWSSATRLLDQKPVWVLADFVFAQSAFEPDYRSRLVFHASSSGCASHRSLELAAQAAVFELIERDAFVRHWLLQQPGICVETRTLPAWIGAQTDALVREGCSVWVQALSPSGIPVWMVMIRCERVGFTSVGTAAGPDAESALESAFTEAQTAALTRLGGVAAPARKVAEVKTPRDHADLHALRRHMHRTDVLLPSGPPASLRQLASEWPASFDSVLDTLRARGFGSPHIVDLTLPDAPSTWSGAPIRSVRALVPGLVPLTFGDGRLPYAMVDRVAPGGRFPHPFP